jgi:hypothetical protein
MTKESRSKADHESLRSIRAIEGELVAALAGETLSGMPDLGGRIFGMRVDEDGSAFARLPGTGRRCMILTAKGRLAIASIDGAGRSVTRPVEDHEVVASTFVPYIRVIELALLKHVAKARDRAEKFAQIARVASAARRQLTT